MIVEKKELEDGKFIVKFEFPIEEVEKEIDRIYKIYLPKLQVKGFRKGKVPKNVFKKVMGQDLYVMVAEELIKEEWEKFLIEEKIQPYYSKVKETIVEEGKPITVKIEYKILKPFPVEDIDEIPVEIENKQITDEDVEKEIKKQARRFAKINVVDRPIQKGDIVTLNWERQMVDWPDDKEGKVVKEDSVVLDTDELLEEIVNNLIGKKSGDEFEFEIVYPENVEDESVRGQKAKFKGKILSVKERQLPEINDELAKKLDPQVSSLDELRTKIKERLEKALEEGRENKIILEVEKYLLEKYKDINIPEELINEKALELVEMDVAQASYMYGMTPEQFLKIAKLDVNKLIEGKKEVAEKIEKLNYILDSYAEKFGINITDEEVREDIEKAAKAVNRHPDDMLEEYEGIKFEQVRRNIRRRKAFEKIKEKVKIKEG